MDLAGWTVIEHSVEFLKINWIELILDYSYRRLIVLGDRRRGHLPLLKPDIVYTEGRRCKRLDVYLPPPPPLRQEGDDSPLPLAPVLVFIHPGGWRWFRKAHFLQLGLRFRRLGFCVVIPDFTQFPEGRCEDSIIDIRGALNWVYNSISRHGGDPCRIFLAGHGSGAHLALLTVVQAAISRSASSGEGYEYGPVTGDGARAIPAVEAMVLLGGIFDPIKQLRDEARAGWHQISALRRALGPSHALTLAHSPAHLLHWAQSFLEPHFLPGKFLIVHGGRDENVSILQSQLLSTLLTAIDQRGGQPSADDEGSESSRSRSSLSVCFKAFKKLDHMGSLIGLMMADDRAGTEMSGYRRVIVEEILAMVGEGG